MTHSIQIWRLRNRADKLGFTLKQESGQIGLWLNGRCLFRGDLDEASSWLIGNYRLGRAA